MHLRDALKKKKKTVKFGTLAQKVGGGQASIPNFFHILIGTNAVGGRGSKGPCHKKCNKFLLTMLKFYGFQNDLGQIEQGGNWMTLVKKD